MRLPACASSPYWCMNRHRAALSLLVDMQAASKRQKAEDVHEKPAMADAAGLPVRVPANRLAVSLTCDGILQLAAAVHAVALDCGLDGIYESHAQVRALLQSPSRTEYHWSTTHGQS